MNQINASNPYTNKEIKSYPMQDISESKDIVNALSDSQSNWKNETLVNRIQWVKQALNYFEKNREVIGNDISEQMGRPFHYAKGEVSGLLERGNYMCDIALETLSQEVIENSENFFRAIEHEPLGVIFVISPWNYPLLTTINSVVPALVAGNTILLKHSSITPEIGQHFQNAFENLGKHKGLLKSIVVDHEVTGKIIEDLPINHVVFTGSVSGGKKILQHCSKKFMQPQLELGGKDAIYVHEDADISQAVAGVVDGALFNTGQSCCGTERTFVHEKIYDEFAAKCKASFAEYKLGDPKDESVNMGPPANPKSIDYMLEQIEEAKKSGAEILCGGKEETINGARFIQPTLLTNVSQHMNVMQEENFGPILPLQKVKSIDEAIRLVNDSKYGLTSAIYTSSSEKAENFKCRVNTGTVFMNRCDYLDPALPWTGVKDSGMGSSLSKYGFYGLTRRKSVHFKKKF